MCPRRRGRRIAGSAAAPSSKAKKGNSTRHAGPLRGFHGPPVHANAVVLNKAGNGFITVTEDSGKVKSVSGDQLTITEGVGNVTYKDVTLTIPSNATVLRNFAKAALSDVKAGDFVHVSQSSEGTFVLATDALTGRLDAVTSASAAVGPSAPGAERGAAARRRAARGARGTRRRNGDRYSDPGRGSCRGRGP